MKKANIIDLAVETGAFGLAKLLTKMTTGTDVHGWTPTMLADQCGQPEIEAVAVEFAKQLATTATGRDIHGWTTTMLADQSEQPEISNVLSQKVHKVTIRDSGYLRDAASVCVPSIWGESRKYYQLILSEYDLRVECSTGNFLLEHDLSRTDGR